VRCTSGASLALASASGPQVRHVATDMATPSGAVMRLKLSTSASGTHASTAAVMDVLP
jgi:hypothetical protein